MQICGGMKYKILFIEILERFAEVMKEMKGCIGIGYFKWRRSC
jgi:hypothetical protein